MNILFVCTGNVSRSYLAEMLLEHEIGDRRLHGIYVSSAGILDNEGMPADPLMIDYLTKLKIPADEHSSRKICKKDIEWADRIYVMENRHREYIHELWPEADSRVERLGRYIDPDQVEDDIIDPYGKAPYYYRVAQEQIAAAVKNLYMSLVTK